MLRHLAVYLLVCTVSLCLAAPAFAQKGLKPLVQLLEQGRGYEHVIKTLRAQPELLESLNLLPASQVEAARLLGTPNTALVGQLLQYRTTLQTGAAATALAQCATPNCVLDLSKQIQSAAVAAAIPEETASGALALNTSAELTQPEMAAELIENLGKLDPALATEYGGMIDDLASGALSNAQAQVLLDELSGSLMGRLEKLAAEQALPANEKLALHLERTSPELFEQFGQRLATVGTTDAAAAEKLGTELMLELVEDSAEARAMLSKALDETGFDMGEFAAKLEAAGDDPVKLAALADTLPAEVEAQASHWLATSGRVALASAYIYTFLSGITGLSGVFKSLGKESVEQMITAATSDPLMGLALGVGGTAAVMSSSATTSMVVALVAGGVLSPELAIPIIMGANIGTASTSTGAATPYLGNPQKYRDALAGGLLSDMFNIRAVATFLPIELGARYVFGQGPLGAGSELAARLLTEAGVGGFSYHSPIKDLIKAGNTPMEWVAGQLTTTPMAEGLMTAALDVGVVVGSLLLLSKLMKSGLHHQAKAILDRALAKSQTMAMTAGAAITAAVQSSSITTTLVVPMTAEGTTTPSKVFPVIVGANLATPLTALLAALALDGPSAQAALQVALVHIMFNGAALAYIYPFKAIRNLPVRDAARFADWARGRRGRSLAVVGVVFFVAPGGYIAYKLAFAEVDDEDSVDYQDIIDGKVEVESKIVLPSYGPDGEPIARELELEIPTTAVQETPGGHQSEHGR